jgi:eukaryotic-like serine/threonine-protein kinase
MLHPGQRIGRYEVLDRIGHGGTASVYRARHVDLGSIHALKRIGIRRPRLLERLMAEGRAQASLQHPNVVRVTDVIDQDGVPILVMEHVDGPSLDALAWHGPLELNLTLSLASGITRGLRAAHVLGLAHRDLKPANVLLEPGDAGVIPRIADFGLVKVLREDQEDLRAPTRAGAAMGTPEFMAPEQIRDASTVDERADLYSLGCILHLLLCGRVPVPADDLLLMYERMTAGPSPRPSARTPGVPVVLDQLVARLLAADPAARPAGCDEVLEVLESGAARIPAGRYPARPADLMAAMRRLEPVWSVLHGPAPDREPRRRPFPVALAGALLVAPLALAAAALAVPPPRLPEEAPVIVGVEPHDPVEDDVDQTAAARAPAKVPIAPPQARRSAAPWPRVTVSGDARRVWLVGASGQWETDLPGRVPPGRYRIVALFPDSEPLKAGSVAVGEAPVSLHCEASQARCSE